jgi:N-methylhydantoinase B
MCPICRPAAAPGSATHWAANPDAVVQDVENGLVSEEAARALYGVVLQGEGRLDGAATEALRERLRAQRL